MTLDRIGEEVRNIVRMFFFLHETFQKFVFSCFIIRIKFLLFYFQFFKLNSFPFFYYKNLLKINILQIHQSESKRNDSNSSFLIFRFPLISIRLIYYFSSILLDFLHVKAGNTFFRILRWFDFLFEIRLLILFNLLVSYFTLWQPLLYLIGPHLQEVDIYRTLCPHTMSTTDNLRFLKRRSKRRRK